MRNRRGALRLVLTGLAVSLALVAARRGVPGAGRLAARWGQPPRTEAKTRLYGYREVNLS